MASPDDIEEANALVEEMNIIIDKIDELIKLSKPSSTAFKDLVNSYTAEGRNDPVSDAVMWFEETVSSRPNEIPIHTLLMAVHLCLCVRPDCRA